jgi:hypothetical protein
MIYELGRRLQTTDFADEVAARAIAKELQENLVRNVGNCVLCLLQGHSMHEEKDFFHPLKPFDPEVVELMLGEHREIVRRIGQLSETCSAVANEPSLARRIEIGDRLNLETNDLFAFYMEHMNNEEATMVPMMWEYFTDAQLRKMRADYHTRTPPQRLEAWMRWTLPALNVNELVVLFRGLKEDGPPELLDRLAQIAAATVDPVRWETTKDRVGL